MKRTLVALIVLASFLSGADRKRKPQLPFRLEIVQASARRVEDRIELDGTVKNVAGVPLREVVLKFEFLSSGLKVVATRNAPLPEELLEAGDDCSYAYQMKDEPRSVKFRLKAMDGRKEELEVVAPGPYPIE